LYDADDRDRFPRALSVFQDKNGSIVKYETIEGSASLILTEGVRHWMPWKREPVVRLFLEMDRAQFSIESLELIDRQFDLVRRAEQRVRRSDRITFIGDLSSLIWSTIKEDREDGLSAVAQTHTESRIDEIQGQVDRASARSSQLTYLAGMAWVGPWLVLLVLGAGFALRAAHLANYRFQTFVSVLIAGGLGAFISVLARMSHGTVWLTPELGLRWVRILGMIRPFLGVVFAAFAYFAFTGDVIGVRLPGGNSNYWAMTIVGFFAGFSERFARDMLVVTQHGVGGSPASTAAEREDEESAPHQRPSSTEGVDG
jgi:hypothetical protein